MAKRDLLFTALGQLLPRLALAALILLTTFSPAAAQAEPPDAIPSPSGHYYIVLQAPSLPTAFGRGWAERLNSPEAAGFEVNLLATQDAVAHGLSSALGREVRPEFRYQLVLNGFSTAMTPEEAAHASQQPGVLQVLPVGFSTLATDAGPEWIDADKIWDGSALADPALATQGEGVVIGVIDTGINFDHPSFSDAPEDGYIYPARTDYLGVCASVGGDPDFQGKCNDKLIGAYNFVTGDPTLPEDKLGHGTHVASTAAGNHVTLTTTASPSRQIPISGAAPHAQLIAYSVCGSSKCLDSSILAAIEQAIRNDVDIINYSLGSETWQDPYIPGNTDYAFKKAEEAGILVVAAAANTTSAPTVRNVAPWMLTVANTTHDRVFSFDLPMHDPAYADIFSLFSSPGPSDAGFPVLKPEVAAPGTEILAAYLDTQTRSWLPPGFSFMNGTSMASPHTAGTAALLMALHPDWTPMEVKSALMLTSFSGVRQAGGVVPATPFQTGAGRVNAASAAVAPFLMDISAAAFTAADPALAGDPAALNLPSLQRNACGITCTWQRTFTNRTGTTQLLTSDAANSPAWLQFSQSASIVAPGESVTLTFTALPADLPLSGWNLGQAWFTAAPLHDPLQTQPIHLPVAVKAGTALFIPYFSAP